MIAGQDVWVISPSIALAALAGAVIIADLFSISKRRLLLGAIIGSLVPLLLALNLWLGWAPDLPAEGFGGLVSADRFAVFFQVLLLAIMVLVLAASFRYMERLRGYIGEYIALVLIATVGMMLLASARELITMYAAFELTALPLAALAALRRDRASIEASIKFLLLSAVGSALMLMGIVAVYAYTGTTYFAEIGQALGSAPEAAASAYAVLVGIVLIVAGLGFKMSVAPWQMWVPDVYQGAPTPVSAFLSTASKASAFAALVALTLTAFAETQVAQNWTVVVAVLAVISMTYGNLGALRQRNLKRLLAYSTIAQAGYMLVGVAAVSSRAPDSVFGGVGAGSVLFYLAAYAVTNLTVFLLVLGLAHQARSSDLSILRGLGKRSPLVASLLTIGVLSLLGVPPTAGFIAKVTVFGAGVYAGLLWAVVIGVLNSIVSAYYYLKILRAMFMQEAEEGSAIASGKLDAGVLGASAAAAVGVLAAGILPFVLGGWADAAVGELLAPLMP